MNFRLLAAALAALSMSILPGCGGSNDDDGSGYVRLLNVSTDYSSLDFYASDSRVSAAVVQDAVGDYVTLGNGTVTFKLKRADSSTTSLSTDRSVTSNVYNTMVAYSTGGTLRTTYLTDSEAAPTSGTAKLRLFNASIEAGSVDLYLTTVGGDLTDVSPTASAIASERFSSYSEIGKGPYRLVITGTGDKTDVRLDIPSITLADQQIATLILTTTPGGVLLHGLLLNQGGSATPEKNTYARVRLVANTTANGTVAATLNNVSLSGGLKSPAVGSYAMVPAGSLTAAVTVNGTSVPLTGLTATAGADLTLMATGTPASPQFSLLSDDNKPPVTTTNAKIRLVNAVNNLGGNITLTADYSAVANDVAFGQASIAASVANGTTYRLEATSPVFTGDLYLATDVTLQATRVYTVFMLGDAATPVGVLRRDR